MKTLRNVLERDISRRDFIRMFFKFGLFLYSVPFLGKTFKIKDAYAKQGS